MASYGSTEKFHFGGLWLTTSEENQHFLQFHFFRREVLKKKLRKPLIDLGNGYFFINWGGKEWWFNLRADSVKVTKERRGPPRKKQLNFPLEQAKPHSPIGFPHSHKTEIDYSTTTITISGWGRGGGRAGCPCCWSMSPTGTGVQSNGLMTGEGFLALGTPTADEETRSANEVRARQRVEAAAGRAAPTGGCSGGNDRSWSCRENGNLG